MTEQSKNVNTMSVKELKEVISSAGLSMAGCVEKSDLRAKATEALNVLDIKSRLDNSNQNNKKEMNTSSKPTNSTQIQTTDLHLGYDCKVLSKSEEARPCDGLVIILHGFGATNSDFVPLVETALQNKDVFGRSDRNVKFILPQAQKGGMFGMPQWWHIDVMKWLTSASQGQHSTIVREEPPGLRDCRAKLLNCIEQACELFEVPLSKVLLCGFSQGAMTAMDLAIHAIESKLLKNGVDSIKDTIAGVCMFSGAPIVIDQWAEVLKKLAEHDQISQDQYKLNVLVTHGHADPVLPFIVSTWTKELLEKSDYVELAYETHSEGHTIGPDSVVKVAFNFWVKHLFNN